MSVATVGSAVRRERHLACDVDVTREADQAQVAVLEDLERVDDVDRGADGDAADQDQGDRRPEVPVPGRRPVVEEADGQREAGQDPAPAVQ